MRHYSIAFIARATRYSPNSVGKDAAILEAVRQRLTEAGCQCQEIVPEDQVTTVAYADAYVSMGRHQDTLNWLGEHERQWKPVINCTASVMICNQRSLLMSVLEDDVPVPPRTGSDGYWVKRAYGCRQSDDDVQYAPDRETADRLCEEMMARGIAHIDVRAHVVGDWLKFYGVSGTDFFYCYLPESGKASVDEQQIRCLAATAAELTSLDVYGGDCVIRPDGTLVLVDLNDWPSFSPCRDEASRAIAERILQRLDNE